MHSLKEGIQDELEVFSNCEMGTLIEVNVLLKSREPLLALEKYGGDHGDRL